MLTLGRPRYARTSTAILINNTHDRISQTVYVLRLVDNAPYTSLPEVKTETRYDTKVIVPMVYHDTAGGLYISSTVLLAPRISGRREQAYQPRYNAFV